MNWQSCSTFFHGFVFEWDYIPCAWRLQGVVSRSLKLWHPEVVSPLQTRNQTLMRCYWANYTANIQNCFLSPWVNWGECLRERGVSSPELVWTELQPRAGPEQQPRPEQPPQPQHREFGASVSNTTNHMMKLVSLGRNRTTIRWNSCGYRITLGHGDVTSAESGLEFAARCRRGGVAILFLGGVCNGECC